MSSILIIEDSEELRRLMSRALAAGGHEVRLASDGGEGLRLFRERPADVVITDIFMPDMDGLEFIREIRRDSPKVRIVAMSGGGSMGNVDILRSALHLGADGILAKPFRIQELLNVIAGDRPAAPQG